MGRGALILLDTPALVWLDFNDPSLGPEAHTAAQEAWAFGRLFASAMSCWEAAMLARKGRLELDRDPIAWRTELLALGVGEMPLDGYVAAFSETLADLRGDPADRLIVATALEKDAALSTADRKLLAWPGPPRRIDARR